MKIILAILILTFVLLSCNGNINEPISLTPYEQWRSLNIHNYSIEQARFCFCPNGSVKMKVIIRADTVFSVAKVSDGTLIPYPASRPYLTIDSIFSIIQNSKFDSLVIDYDPQYGYPSKLDINPQLHPVDGGILYQTSNLQVINNVLDK